MRKELQTLATMLGYAPAATRIGDAMREHAEHVIDLSVEARLVVRRLATDRARLAATRGAPEAVGTRCPKLGVRPARYARMDRPRIASQMPQLFERRKA